MGRIEMTKCDSYFGIEAVYIQLAKLEYVWNIR